MWLYLERSITKRLPQNHLMMWLCLERSLHQGKFLQLNMMCLRREEFGSAHMLASYIFGLNVKMVLETMSVIWNTFLAGKYSEKRPQITKYKRKPSLPPIWLRPPYLRVWWDLTYSSMSFNKSQVSCLPYSFAQSSSTIFMFTLYFCTIITIDFYNIKFMFIILFVILLSW